MTSHLMFTCNGTLLIEHPSVMEPYLLNILQTQEAVKQQNLTCYERQGIPQWSPEGLNWQNIKSSVDTQCKNTNSIQHWAISWWKYKMYVHNLFHFARPTYLQLLCIMEFDPQPTHNFIYLYSVCVWARAQNDNPFLSEMLSKACPYLAVPKICRIASGIKI